MRGYNSALGSNFRKGIVNDLNTPLNTGGLLDAVNCRVGDGGLEGFKPSVLMNTDVMDFDWPFPQVFHTDSGIYLCNRDYIKRITLAGDGTLTVDETILDLSEESNLTLCWPWTLVDIPMYPMFVSGDCLVYYDGTEEEWITFNSRYATIPLSADPFGESGTNWNSTWTHPVAGCFNNGQVILVGASDSSASPSESRLIRWSEIGALRFLGHTGTTVGTAGQAYITDDDNDVLMRCLPLGKATIVYGSYGIYALVPVTEPVPTFSLVRIACTGINNPLAAAAGHDRHIFVDRLGCLWVIGADLKPVNLGYQHLFEDITKVTDITLSDGIISILYNRADNEFYIGTGSESYLYKDNVLTRMSCILTGFCDFRSVQTLDEETLEIYRSDLFGYYINTHDLEMGLQTTPIDFKTPGFKTIEQVSIGGDFDVAMSASIMVEYRNNRFSSFRETPWCRVNPQGVARINVTGSEFRINVKCFPYDGALIDYVSLAYKYVDRRYIRGIYASMSSPGAGEQPVE